MGKLIVSIVCISFFIGCNTEQKKRETVSLNGTWQIAKTDSREQQPSSFNSGAPVPGLVDMASPNIDVQDSVYENSVYWYRKSFRINTKDKDIVLLKINKAKYQTTVFVNGKLAGENVYSFTPSEFDVKNFLKDGENNEILIAVGCKNNLPDTVTNGGDFEKTKYIPGIYDDVKLILANYPYVRNVQTIPDVKNEQLRIVAEILAEPGNDDIKVSYAISEAVSKIEITSGDIEGKAEKIDNNLYQIDFTVPMAGCRLWSPESPFLYHLQLGTPGDKFQTRFGMRTFEGTKDSGVFLLNGKPYYMRGTNVCIFRFFEDPDRNSLPWESKWITKLHDRFKEMHWNSIRYCIGFPPESWYEIADSIGFLIQDEYPIWTGAKSWGEGKGFENLLPGLTSKMLAAEYSQWLCERWNHPCVVVWDAQNESLNDTTGKAIQLVRSIDYSNRPWDNGYAAPDLATDAIESHPYLFSRYQKIKPDEEGYLKELLAEIRIPNNDPNSHSPSPDGKRYANPIILNEYGWIWLNRNGTTTTLTDKVYEHVFPNDTTPEMRLETYAKHLGILTEYWRVHRKAAAVMHFCGLGYSRPEKPRGQTSDNFTDIKNLVYEPNFYEYVKPAFSPVGMMLDFWEKKVSPGQTISVPVHIVNDTYENYEDTAEIALYADNTKINMKSFSVSAAGLAKKVVEIQLDIPKEKGELCLEASFFYKGGLVKSRREFWVE